MLEHICGYFDNVCCWFIMGNSLVMILFFLHTIHPPANIIVFLLHFVCRLNMKQLLFVSCSYFYRQMFIFSFLFSFFFCQKTLLILCFLSMQRFVEEVFMWIYWDSSFGFVYIFAFILCNSCICWSIFFSFDFICILFSALILLFLALCILFHTTIITFIEVHNKSHVNQNLMVFFWEIDFFFLVDKKLLWIKKGFWNYKYRILNLKRVSLVTQQIFWGLMVHM